MPKPKKTSPTELLKELLETAAQSGDVQRLAAMREIIGDWSLRQFMPDVAETAQRLEVALQKKQESSGIINMFNAPVGQAMGVVEKVETKES